MNLIHEYFESIGCWMWMAFWVSVIVVSICAVARGLWERKALHIPS